MRALGSELSLEKYLSQGPGSLPNPVQKTCQKWSAHSSGVREKGRRSKRRETSRPDFRSKLQRTPNCMRIVEAINLSVLSGKKISRQERKRSR